MILVIGGRASGKRDYVRSLGYADADIADGVIDARPVVYNLQALVFADHESAPNLLEPLLTKDVVVCDEVGSGVIPTDRDQRLAREATGRLCVHLAQRAERVVRLVAGVPTTIN
ncbi:MAG: bifunctional adenosylcobinamide kinase/adenosylcobinamide-phosphate guanylyltransferase [Oscillospiraceae bacterium]|jgi:adenosyl cobinamide kinase/adenosyl cobinamide phosphate guanylyltransferase|nr:bifunctional adenosylcobinamide kinase/adenosylcobinamide-phosphate guanylyltransferase [Oscillospiraceae bacterium]